MAQLSHPITYRTLLAFAVPMIVSQLFMMELELWIDKICIFV